MIRSPNPNPSPLSLHWTATATYGGRSRRDLPSHLKPLLLAFVDAHLLPPFAPALLVIASLLARGS